MITHKGSTFKQSADFHQQQKKSINEWSIFTVINPEIHSMSTTIPHSVTIKVKNENEIIFS